jgi:hypothetical protein
MRPEFDNRLLVDADVSNNGNPTGSGKSGYNFSTREGTASAGVKRLRGICRANRHQSDGHPCILC